MSLRNWPRRRIWIAVFAVLVGSSGMGGQALHSADSSRAESLPALPAGAPSPLPVVRIVLHQAISEATSSYIRRVLEELKGTGRTRAQAQALLMELDTPGGDLEATRELVKLMLGSSIPLIVYVSPSGARAASAGTLITLAAHVAAMAPGTHIGAAHPVIMFGNPDDVMRVKILNDTAAFAESIAQMRGRNAEWAVSAVRESRSIAETAALKLRVVDLIAQDDTDLMRQLDGRRIALSSTEQVVLRTHGATLLTHEMSAAQGFLAWAGQPDILFLLLVAGLIGVYIEVSHPGLIVPGLLGAGCWILALVVMQSLPVSYGAVALIVVGAVLLAAEAYITSFGALALAGLGSILYGALILFDETRSDLGVNRVLIGVSIGTLAMLAVLVGRLLIRSRRLPQRSLQANLVGQTGEVVAAIGPDHPGHVRVTGERWKARSAQALPVGATVVVTAVEGLVLEVATVASHEMTGSRSS